MMALAAGGRAKALLSIVGGERGTALDAGPIRPIGAVSCALAAYRAHLKSVDARDLTIPAPNSLKRAKALNAPIKPINGARAGRPKRVALISISLNTPLSGARGAEFPA